MKEKKKKKILLSHLDMVFLIKSLISRTINVNIVYLLLHSLYLLLVITSRSSYIPVLQHFQ